MSRPLQTEVAARLGMSQSTVSLALRGSPRLPLGTRKRVEEAARSLGYQPDPMAAALARHRHDSSPHGYLGHMAMISSSPMRLRMVPSPNKDSFREFDFMTQQAARRGYQLERVCIGTDSGEQKKWSRQLSARGFMGLFLVEGETPAESWAIDWDHFCVVDIDGLAGSRLFPSVFSHHFQSMMEVMRQLKLRGYRRPGLWLDELYNQVEAWDSWRGAFAVKSPEYFGTALMQTDPEESLNVWLRKHKPDVVITFGDGFQSARWQEKGYHLPKRVGLCGLDVDPQRNPQVSGIYQDKQREVLAALQLMESLIRNRSRGCQPLVAGTCLMGEWQEGTTLRPARST
ncbi:MAG: LacI family DNA-binding transcriptional regulator [Candidatus Methylacidiphilales bacterium]|nr:LacI family DNA-binding transcriptional regulator [Candidatus Methylacidiphilales bacterium]